MRAEVDYNGVVTWEFGDGASDTGETVSHTYTEVGIHEVVMSVVYPNTGKLVTLNETVIVAGDPVAAFTYDIYEGLFSWLPSCFGSGEPEEDDESVEIQFDATSSYPGIDSRKYYPAQLHWDFGDGVQEAEGVETPFGSVSASSMRIRHQYAVAGVYTVTMTLTDNLGYTDSVTQTITVGTPGEEPDDDEEVELDDFVVGVITWEPGDEEEDEGDCIFIDGTVQNNAVVAAGVELTATAYDAVGTPVGTFTYWPAGATNIGVGVDYVYGFFLCDLSIPGDQVVTVEVVVSDVMVY